MANYNSNNSKELILQSRIQSRKALLEQIKSYIAVQDDYDAWNDFFESSVGKTVLNILTSLTELMLFKIETRSRESYLFTADTLSAVYLLAQGIGYNPNRKKHATGRVRAVIEPYAFYDVVIPKHFQIGDEYPVVTKNNVEVKSGSRSVKNIEVMQGRWKYVYYGPSEQNVRSFYPIDEDSDYEINALRGVEWESIYLEEGNFDIDQFELYVEVDGEQIDVLDKTQIFNASDKDISTVEELESDDEKVKYVKDNPSLILDQNFLMTVNRNSVLARTYYTGGVVLLFGDGNFGKKLSSSSVVKIKYLVTEGSDLTIDRGVNLGNQNISGEIFDFTTQTRIQGGTDEDSIDKVKFTAPRFFYTQGRAVTKFDYEAVAMSYPGVVSAKVERLEDLCCTICLAALKQNGVSWSKSEVNEFLNYMDKYKMVSTYIDFWEPEAIDLDLEIRIVLKREVDLNLIREIVDDEIAKSCFQLGTTFRSTKLLDNLADSHNSIRRVYLDSVNGKSDYPDIELSCYGFFKPGNVSVSTSIEY